MSASHHGGADAGRPAEPGQRSATTEPTTYPASPRPPGTPRSGRHRRHQFPARPHRLAPTFTEREYAAIVAAAARLGLTPTGYCAHAAVTLAADPAIQPPAPSGGDPANSVTGARAEALAALQAELADTRTAVVRVGTNLNQAVRALNASGEAPVWLHHVVDLCGRVLAAVDAAASRIHRRL